MKERNVSRFTAFLFILGPFNIDDNGICQNCDISAQQQFPGVVYICIDGSDIAFTTCNKSKLDTEPKWWTPKDHYDPIGDKIEPIARE